MLVYLWTFKHFRLLYAIALIAFITAMIIAHLINSIVILIITTTIFEKTNAFLFFVKELLIPNTLAESHCLSLQIHPFWKIPSLVG